MPSCACVVDRRDRTVAAASAVGIVIGAAALTWSVLTLSSVPTPTPAAPVRPVVATSCVVPGPSDPPVLVTWP